LASIRRRFHRRINPPDSLLALLGQEKEMVESLALVKAKLFRGIRLSRFEWEAIQLRHRDVNTYPDDAGYN
jgi:hypothetical protein